MKAADAAAVRKQLGCLKRCAAAGPNTHHRDCMNVGKWLDEAPRTSRSREASVPVGELEALVLKWGPCGECKPDPNSVCGILDPACMAKLRCGRAIQALIDKVTP